MGHSPKVPGSRYNVTIPDDLDDKLQEIVAKGGYSVADIFRLSLKITLLAFEHQNDPDRGLYIKLHPDRPPEKVYIPY